jgi:hypothetical protein
MYANPLSCRHRAIRLLPGYRGTHKSHKIIAVHAAACSAPSRDAAWRLTNNLSAGPTNTLYIATFANTLQSYMYFANKPHVCLAKSLLPKPGPASTPIFRTSPKLHDFAVGVQNQTSELETPGQKLACLNALTLSGE